MQSNDQDLTADINSRPASLYRMFNEHGVLLYIGMTADIGARLTSHQAIKPWWTEVCTITVTPYATRGEAEDAERAAIIAEQPLWNEQIRELSELRAQQRAQLPRTKSAMPDDGLAINAAMVTAARVGIASMNPRAIRERAGVSQVLMAQRIGVTAAGLSRAEAGTRRPRAETAVRWYRELLKLEILLASSIKSPASAPRRGAA